MGKATVDHRADLYALGCVAYYLLTGDLVFTGETPLAMALAHVNEAPIPLRERSEFAIPSDLDGLILQCLAKDPAQRPASAGELAPHSAQVSRLRGVEAVRRANGMAAMARRCG